LAFFLGRSWERAGAGSAEAVVDATDIIEALARG